MRAAAIETESENTLALRERLEGEIERLIAMLDTVDGDENLEPSLGRSGDGSTDDREGDPCDDGEPDVDGEPSMGWANPMGWRIGEPAPSGGADCHASCHGSDYED